MSVPSTLEPEQVSVEELVKRFELPHGIVTAVDRVSFTVAPGEFFCIVGPSGCGKSTILRILAGLQTKTTGDVTVRYRQSGRQANAMVFQEQSIFPWMTVEQNVMFGLRRQPAEQARNTARDFLERVGLSSFAQTYPHQLSGGMRQRVSIARAFATDPEILLMDEPFAALDEQNKLLLQEELMRIWEDSGKTVIYITHSIEEAVALGDRVMIMTASPGRLKLILPIDFPRPRNILELRNQPAFGSYVYRIWGHLKEEVLRAKEQAWMRA